MAVLNVNPTRMELTRLKKQLSTALRGHKLLKDKRDELMRQFLDMIRETKTLREEVEERLKSVNNDEASTRNVMSVDIPVYSFKTRTSEQSDIFSYGFASTSFELDDAVSGLSDLLPKMLKLAEMEKSVKLMADEIEKTRRRVNALEHVMIPRYQETIHFISMKLEENERASRARLMKVKDMMIEENIEYKHTHPDAV